MDKISFDEFKRLEFKVGKIMQVERIENADKLFKLQVDLGEDHPRQIVSGIVPYYSEDELIGKLIIVVSNLVPAKFKGEVSDGMLLAAGDREKDTCILLTTEKEVDPGTPIT